MFSKKEFAVVNNLRFISWTNFMLSRVEYEKCFITLEPGYFENQILLKLVLVGVYSLAIYTAAYDET